MPRQEKDLQDEAAERRAGELARGLGRGVQPDRLAAALRRDGRGDDRAGQRVRHRQADGHEDAKAHQLGERHRGRGEAGAQGVDDDADLVDAAPSHEVADAPEAQRQARDHDRADDRDPLQGREADGEVVLNLGQRHVDAAVRAREHEGGGAQHRQQLDLGWVHALDGVDRPQMGR